MQQATKQATSRETIYTLHTGLNEIVFNDTKPNHIYINNLSTSDLFLGVGMIPSVAIYDKYIAPSSDTLYARELGVTRIQIFVQGTNNTQIKLTTFVADFDPSTLASSTDTVISGGGSGGDFDGIIRGFNSPLPSGGNNIGKVVVSEMPALKVEQGALAAGTNNIGKVDIASMPSLPSGTAKIGNVGVVGGLTIDSMPPVSLNGGVTVGDISIKGESRWYTISVAVSTTEIVKELGFASKSIKFLTNDGDSDLYITFNDASTSGATDGLNGYIKLASGETLNELNIAITKINMVRLSGSGNVRAVIV